MKRWPLLLPFLFAVAPTLTLYASNSGQTEFSATLFPMGVSLALTLVLLPLCVVVFRSPLRGAVALSLFWWVAFSYGHAAAVIGKYPVAGHNPANAKVLLPLTCLLLVAGGVLIRRARSEPVLLSRALLVVSVSMLGASLITVARVGASRQPFDRASVVPDEALVAGSVARKPDIFYIIFDRYGSNVTLTRRYGYDNTPMLDHLRARGFYVADDSRANYLVTAQSLASSLNMAHLLPLSEVIGRESEDWLPVFDLLADSRLRRFLADQGYRYVHIGPKWAPTTHSPYADRNVRYSAVPEFTRMLISTTMFYPVLYRLGLDNQDLEKFRRVQYQMDVLAGLPAREPEPLFVFAHFLMPHGPYVFNRDGSYRLPEVANVHDEPTNFVEQVAYLDGRIRALVDSLLASYPADNPPVVVVQGDEGPYPARTQPHSFDWQTATNEELSEKMRILNAIHAPGCDDRFYPSMTPVNTFRILLNCYFGTALEPLPDRSYSYRDQKRLYDYFDVTERVEAGVADGD
ncbi:MAG: LTA synthase family protein [Candidatus Latescibacteria bacterium]|nr:LTA synthase family protein [Candidatus Latescibacterota bacterium]